ncbi:hypothetical protein MXB_4376, partial [Myxobolus squamalis]
MANIPNTKNDDNEIPIEHEMKEFLDRINKYVCVIPNDVTANILKSTGVQCYDEKIVKIVSLAAQKYTVDIINDCYQLCKSKQSSSSQKKESQKNTNQLVLTYEDLECVLRERGID